MLCKDVQLVYEIYVCNWYFCNKLYYNCFNIFLTQSLAPLFHCNGKMYATLMKLIYGIDDLFSTVIV